MGAVVLFRGRVIEAARQRPGPPGSRLLLSPDRIALRRKGRERESGK